MANENKIVELLRNEAMINPAFNAVSHIFAVRQRTRYKVTIHSLMAAMKKEGFTFSKEQYINVLKFLSTLGMGSLVLDGKKRVKALDHIKITLQSIGQTALGSSANIKRQSQTHKFHDLTSDNGGGNKALPEITEVAASEPIPSRAEVKQRRQVEAPPREVKPPVAASKMREASYPTFLTVLIEGRLVAFPGPEVAPDNLGETLTKFKKLAKEPNL